MKKHKKNDCVELKDRIQHTLYAQYKNLTDEERERHIFTKLADSNSPIAQFWKPASLKVADGESEYKIKKK